MPILEISALRPTTPVNVPAALSKINLAIAKAYGCDPRHCWATVTWLEPGHYAEGDLPANTQPADTHPPIARLTCFEGKSAAEIEAVLLAASHALSEAFALCDNVFITYVEAKSGAVVAENEVVRT